MKVAGMLLMLIGLVVGYFALSMDTSVDTPMGLLHNLSLANQRQTFLIVSGIAFIGGAVLLGVKQ